MRIYINEIKVKDDGIYCFSEDPTDGLGRKLDKCLLIVIIMDSHIY